MHRPDGILSSDWPLALVTTAVLICTSIVVANGIRILDSNACMCVHMRDVTLRAPQQDSHSLIGVLWHAWTRC